MKINGLLSGTGLYYNNKVYLIITDNLIRSKITKNKFNRENSLKTGIILFPVSQACAVSSYLFVSCTQLSVCIRLLT